MSIEIIIILVIAIIILLEAVGLKLIKNLKYIAYEEFPKIDKDDLKKFTTFDPEFGHILKYNNSNEDDGITTKGYKKNYKIDQNGSRETGFDANELVEISTFGDSFCQCRGVEENETWQYFLGEKFNKPVYNFGVGGHGLDQALMLYRKYRTKKLGKYIIFAVSPCTIERMVGVYKHYIEFGNTFGVKPRFVLDNDELCYYEQPAKSKDELLTIKNKKEYIHKIDENYKGYFLKYSARRPYFVYFLKNPLIFMQAIGSFLPNNKFSNNIKTFFANKTRKRTHNIMNKYFAKLYKEQATLFIKVWETIAQECKEDNRIPILMMMPDYTNIKYIKQNGHYYSKVLEDIRKKKFLVIDTYNILENESPYDVFLKNDASGHQSPQGNLIVSSYLFDMYIQLLEDENV